MENSKNGEYNNRFLNVNDETESLRTIVDTRRNSSLQNLVLLYLFLLKVNRKRGYNVTFLEISVLNIKLWSY